MELYALYFAILALFNAVFAHHRHTKSSKRPLAESSSARDDEEEDLSLPIGEADLRSARNFKLTYFGVYTLGPYMYTLYKDSKSLPESTVARLFTLGFLSAGITAGLAGSLADRVLAGLSTTLLYSVFETWMISEFHRRELGHVMGLGEMFSGSVMVSGVVAVASGVVGEAVVGWTGSKAAPFAVAVGCLAAAGGGIWKFWGENFGEADGEKGGSSVSLKSMVMDKRILSLGLATTLFEGCMFLFVFFWTPALKSSRAVAGTTASPPFGLIFSCFMSAMMLGSMLFSVIDLRSERETGRLLLSILAMAAISLMVPVLMRTEGLTFWSFAIFEACVGMYFPTMGRLKSEIVDDDVRGKVYALMRLPLNIFVVLALGLTQEGDGHRDRIFTASGGLLLGAFFAVQKWFL
ncbi:unnamed protein product [Zymoseptoria tritici ST99CH_1A5]|uniref:Molybdate-anion transporter n=1 Tax=Zymoseptoria tritici ST99CH_1A5 TaxID=1276529 RepID=A0A1Y6LIY0_ZYMTR|nr:unnamed protein product [Zymoseptoria tritici ST99CH_1A5]